VQERPLASGMRLEVAEKHQMAVVHLALVIRGGGWADRPGVAALTAELVANGAAAFPDGPDSSWPTALAPLGGELEVRTERSETVFELDVSREHWAEAARALALMMGRGRLGGRSFAAARDHAMREAMQQPLEPYGWAGPELLERTLLGGAAAWRATRQELARDRLEHCARYYRSHYHAKAATLLVVGDVAGSEVERVVSAAFATAPQQSTDEQQAAPERGPGERHAAPSVAADGKGQVVEHPASISLLDRPLAAVSTAYVGLLAPQATLQRIVAIGLWAEAWTGAEASTLGRKLAAVGAELHAELVLQPKAVSLLELRLVATPERFDAALDVLLDSLRELRTHPVSESEVSLARRALLTALTRDAERSATVARRIELGQQLELGAGFYDSYGALLEATDGAAIASIGASAALHAPSIVVVGDARMLLAPLTRRANVVLRDASSGFEVSGTFAKQSASTAPAKPTAVR